MVDRSHDRYRAWTAARVAQTDPVNRPNWLGPAQVFWIDRIWQKHSQSKRSVHYGTTGLSPERETPNQLLALKRGHWLIENRTGARMPRLGSTPV